MGYSTKIKSFYEEHCIYLPAMAGWFLFSALLSTYNKLIFGSGELHFPCPLFMTSIHFFAQWLFSWSLCKFWPLFWGGDRIQTMSFNEFWKTSLPCGLVTCGDVGLSNLSLVLISISFYTMVKASTPIFVLIWAYLFGIEKITVSLLGVVLIIALGEFLTVVGEASFDWMGFVLCLTASILSGARWTLVQLKLQQMDPPLKTTVATMRLLAPSMFWGMVVLSAILERPWNTLPEYIHYGRLHPDKSSWIQDGGMTHILLMGLLGAFFAIAMIMCEFYLIMHASAIILMIGGVVKEMITIIVGVSFFHDDLNRINMTGCGIVFLGVALYKISFHLQRKKERQQAGPGTANVSKPNIRGYNPVIKTTASEDERDFGDDDDESPLDKIMDDESSDHHNGNGVDLLKTNGDSPLPLYKNDVELAHRKSALSPHNISNGLDGSVATSVSSQQSEHSGQN